ncbi:glucose-1-phosphate cytidylyltransferase [bacterium]|nr:glucose-1-phosphate cytidylyltransferase [bacterium]
MKVVILAGGLGTRLSEETHQIPKPMVEIGGRPILWHIMKQYAQHGCSDFIICCGYKGYVIKEYFANYLVHMSDVTFDLGQNSMKIHRQGSENWNVTLIDTGDHTQTGGRLKRVAPYLEKDEAFCFTYGDGVSDVNIRALIDFHHQHGRWATVTATIPPGRFGALALDEHHRVTSFIEKPMGDGHDGILWEAQPLETLARSGQLMAYQHRGFWQPMDTLRDKMVLEGLWQSGKAPWKCWA